MPKEPIVVNGDNVEYYQDKKEVVGTGNIMITYQDVVLTSRNVYGGTYQLLHDWYGQL